MIRAIIIDDEQHCIDSLQFKLQEFCPEVEVVGMCNTVNEAIVSIEKNIPDLIFLDINMPGDDGFTLLEKIRRINFEIIFTTAYDKYAVRAFEFSALHFLLKPVSSQQLIEAMGRYKARKLQTSLSQVTTMMHSIRNQTRAIDKIAIPTSSGYEFIPLKDIIRLQADSNYTKFHLIGATTMVVPRTLKEYENILSEESFIRIHQSHLINLSHVREYKKSEGIIMMDDGTMLELSSRKKAQFLNNLSKYIKL